MNKHRRMIDPTQDIDRHVSESLGARSQRNIVEDIENVSRTPRTKRLQVLENGTPIADVDAINLTGGVSTSVQGRMVTANFTGGGASTGTGTITVQSNDVDVDTAVTTIDFSTHFTVTSSPSGEANISLAGSGATIVVQEGDVDVDTAVGTLDFDASDFNVTSSPSGEANIALAYGTSAGTPAEGNHNHDSTYVNVSGDTMTGALEIDATSSGALSVKTAAGATEYFAISTSSGAVYLNNAADFRVYSDNGSTVVYGIDGATGVVTFGLPGTGSVASIRSGTGSPEGVVSAQVGSVFLRTDGSTDTAVYRKETGTTGNTGWVAIAAGSGLGFAAVQRLIAIGAPM